MSALNGVLAAIARAVDPEASDATRLGTITLRPHQAEAVGRVRAALRTFGGALLADAPGLGKTYVALAAAGGYSRCVVAAPAALRGMWRESAARAGAAIDFVSLEALSRGAAPTRPRLLIVDEAHRVANPAARRYARVAALAHQAHILLLTATPVRNRRAELHALLGLFLGPDADMDDDSLIARCVIRRDAAPGGGVPSVHAARPMFARGGTEIAAALRALPPPLALADGTQAAGLVATGLARCWCSSVAALHAALTRRLQRGAVLADALASGRLPSRSEIRAWVLGDDGTQLAFPFLAGEVDPGSVPAFGTALSRHVTAVEILRDLTRERVAADTAWRARHLRDLCRRHHTSSVVAFTAFDATARALFSALRREPGVVLLTGRGAETTGGSVPRADVVNGLSANEEFAGSSARRGARGVFDIRLLIATDLLSEGANLQRASAIVHLDDPWTPAGIAQRIGRAARLGSDHDTVFVHRFVPAPAARTLLALDRLHRTKRAASRAALAPGEAAERLRGAVAAWRDEPRHDEPRHDEQSTRAVVAACAADRDGFVAAIHADGREWVVCGTPHTRRRWMISDDATRLHRFVCAVRRAERPRPSSLEVGAIMQVIRRWIAHRYAQRSAGLGRQPSRARRRLFARLDALAARCSPTRLAVIAHRVGRIRDELSVARGSHVERMIEAMLRRPSDDDGWLDEIEAVLAGEPRRQQDLSISRADRCEVVALLVLRRGSYASQEA